MVRRLQETPGYVEPQQTQQSPVGVQETSPPVSAPTGGTFTATPQEVEVENPGSNPLPISEITTPEITGIVDGAIDLIDDVVGSEPEDTPISTEVAQEPYKSVFSSIAGKTETELRTASLPPPPKERAPSVIPAYESVLDNILAPEETESQPRTFVAARAGAYPPPSGAVPTSASDLVKEFSQSPEAFTLSAESIIDRTTEGSNWNFGELRGDSLVIHHTAGRGTVDGVINTFKERGYPAHFIIDREGQVVQVLGTNQRGQHTRPSEVEGVNINNSNSWGVEIMAKDDDDVLPAQVKAAIGLARRLNADYGMPMDRIVGHGYINSHKQATEGKTVISVLEGLRGQI